MPPTRASATRPLHARLDAGETLIGSFVNAGSSVTAEIMSLAGYDWLVIDLEHGAGDEHVLLGQLQALAGTSAGALVRVEGIEPARILHALDLGADGILVPRIRAAAEAAECVELCRYSGRRGVARYNRSWHWGLLARELVDADEAVVCAVQIETAEALEAVDEIAAVDGVDILFVGPADLGHALGMNCPPDDVRLLAAVRPVADAARSHGKAAGMLVGTPEQARAYRDAGFSFLGCASDTGLLAVAAAAAADDLRALADGAAARRGEVR